MNGVRFKVAWLLRLLIAASIVGPAVIFVVAAWQSREDAVSSGYSRAATIAGLLQEHAGRVFETQELMLDEVDALIRGMSWDEIGQSAAVHRALAAIVARRSAVNAISLIDPEGRYRNGSAATPPRDLDKSDREYFKVERGRDAGVIVSKVDRSTVTGRPSFTVTRRRSLTSGAFDGVLVASVEQNYFAQVWGSVADGVAHSVMLVRSDGEILAALPSGSSALQRLAPGSPLMRRITTGADAGTFDGRGERGSADEIISFRKVNPYGLYVVFALDKASLLASWRHEVARFAAYAIVASSCLVALAMLAWYVSRREAAANRLAGMFDQAAVGIGQIRLDGRLVAVNDRFCRILDYRREDLLGLRIDDLVDPADRAAEAAQIARLLAGEIAVYAVEQRFLRRNGVPAWVRVTTSLARDESARADCRISIVEDITERKQAERALREAEQRLRVTVERAPVGIAEVDLEGHYLRINEKFCEIRRATPQSVLASTFLQVTHPDDRAREEALWTRLKRGEIPSYSIEKRFKADDGEWHWTAITCAIVRDGEGRARYGIRIAADIDERERALAQLRDSESRLSLAREAAGIGIWDLDVATGRVIWSKECYALYGVPLGTVVDVALWMARLHPDDVARVQEELAPANASSATVESEFRVIRPDGTVRWLSVRARQVLDSAGKRVVRLIGADMDITARKEFTAELERHVAERTVALEGALEQLRVSEARYSAFFESAPYDMFVIDVRDGEFVYEQANPHAGASLNAAAAALVGRTPSQVFAPQTAQFLIEQYGICAATGHKREYDMSPGDDAGPPTQHGILVPLHYRDGKVVKLFCTSIDLTELRRVEDALRQAQKMEAIGHLTGGVAHDFNNLLTVISGNLGLLEERVHDHAARRLIAAAQRGADRGARLTQSLLAFARKQALRPETVDANVLIKEFYPVLRGASGDAIELQLLLSPTLHVCRVDPAQFQAAILNLVRNAGDAMNGSGRIVIETDNVELEAEEGDAAAGNYVRVSVADTGSGMSAAVLDRVFEPFFTTKEVGKGSGLGLSQVYGFVNQSDGHVRISSELGIGTTVRILLPRADGDGAASGTEDDVASAAASRGNERILIVDDDHDVLTVLEATLQALGYRIVTARDGVIALAMIERGEAVDLLLTDYAMPKGMSGHELAQRASALKPSLRTLLISGYATMADLASRDDVAWLRKPYRRDDLARAVRHALDGRPSLQ